MSSRARVAFSKKLALSLLAPAILAGSVIAPMNANAEVQQDLRIAQNGTVYQFFCSNGSTDHLRVTNASMAIAFNAPATLAGGFQQGNPLISSSAATPLVALAKARRSAILTLPSCLNSADITFNNSGSGSWTGGGSTFAGFGDAGLTAVTSGGAIPAASITVNGGCGSSVYGFGGTATCSVPNPPATQPSDGFNLTLRQGVLIVYDGSTLIPANTAGQLNVAGGAAGFDSNGSNVFQDSTRDQDSTFVSVTTTTTTTTTTTSTTTTTHVVPTVGNWGMAVLGLTFLGAMAWMLGARRSHVRS